MSRSLIRVSAYSLAASAIVVLGVAVGCEVVKLCTAFPSHVHRSSFLSGFMAWDGEWYERIVVHGYDQTEKAQSTVAFFPLYPLVATAFHKGTGASPAVSLLFVSNVCFVASVCFFVVLLRGRGVTHSGECEAYATYSVLALCLHPVAFYFRMAYSESLFLMGALATMASIHFRQPVWIAACVCGAVTAIRPVGVALLAPFLLYVWTSSDRTRDKIVRGALYLPCACWGLLTFLGYQWAAFGDPIVSMRNQDNWNSRSIPGPWELALNLATLEPLLAVYDSGSECWWSNDPPYGTAVLNMSFMNPVFFAASVALVGIGAWKKWITSSELLFAIGIFAIPYGFHSYAKCGASLARYALVCFPVYIVIGRLLAAAGIAWAALLLSLSACLLCIYSALFASWYYFF